MQLEDLKKSVTEMSHEELLDTLKEVRKERRTPVKTKKQKAPKEPKVSKKDATLAEARAALLEFERSRNAEG